MSGGFNTRPSNYQPPRRGVERLICSRLIRLILNDKNISVDFGDSAELTLHDVSDFVVASPRLLALLKLALAPDLWVGESYVAGDWYLKKGDLADFLATIQEKANAPYRRYFDLVSELRGIRYYFGQYLANRYYTRRVRKHYDVDAKIYEAFLDEEMLYTCAFFPRGDEPLASAQQIKLEAVIDRLALPRPDAEVLDIGCGWGGFARAIARQHPTARVCGLSIARSQIDWAVARDATCLTPRQRDRIEYRLEDYVNHDRRDHYDAIAVIGMIEHVGLGGYNEFFAKLSDFLKLRGRVVIHTIVSPRSAVPSNAWIDRHVFTGGYAPSISELIKAAEQQSFRISAAHIYPPRHYRKTIECWLANFLKNASSTGSYLKQIGYADEEIDRFMRIWTFYLSGVRNMFSEQDRGSHQIIQLCLQKL
jgi:cyclopropane-fatty-acyl-phospholipid synthase